MGWYHSHPDLCYKCDVGLSPQAGDGGGLVSLSPWLWLLAVWSGHQHTAKLRGALRESSGRRCRPHSECQGKGMHCFSLSLFISPMMLGYFLWMSTITQIHI